MIKVSKADLLTPANAVTTIGIVLTTVGAFHLNTITGFIIAAIGKALDTVDGPIARRTHTSNFGAFFDASADKFTALVLIIASYHFKLAPVIFLDFVLAYHALIASMALDAEAHDIHPHPSRLGKYTMFLHVGALLSFSLAKNITAGHSLIHDLAIALAIIGVVAGLVSLGRYLKAYIVKIHPPTHK